MKGKLSIVKTIVVLVILGLVGVLGVLGVGTVKTYLSGATAGFDPKNVAVKIDDTQVTISWDSDKPSLGYVQYGTTPASLLLSVPSRDELQSATSDSSHHIIIKTFKPNTNYYFHLRVGTDVAAYNEWEVFDNGGIPYSFKTKGDVSVTPTIAPVAPTDVPQPTAVVANQLQGTTTNCQSGEDYNGDGTVNSLDMIYCRQHKGGVIAMPTATPSATGSATSSCVSGVDYNKDGVVNSLDMIYCRQNRTSTPTPSNSGGLN